MKNAMQLKAIMKKLAKENQISAQLVLQNYMLERFLERVSLSPYRDNYIIKGGFLISSMVGLNSRATMDMDATIKGYPVTQDTIQKMIEQILTVPVDDDITFTFKSIGEIREGDEYTGYRVALTADFPPMAVPLKLDITTGDKITPREIQYDYKLMLEDRHIQVMAYNLATILAEKLETVISRSDQNTRPRDYYDVYLRFTKARFYVVDPENEYAPLVQELGGEVVNISVDSSTYFNPLDFKPDKSTDIPPYVAKAEFVLSLCEQIMKKENVLPGDGQQPYPIQQPPTQGHQNIQVTHNQTR